MIMISIFDLIIFVRYVIKELNLFIIFVFLAAIKCKLESCI